MKFCCCGHLSSFIFISKVVVVLTTTLEQEPSGLAVAILRKRHRVSNIINEYILHYRLQCC